MLHHISFAVRDLEVAGAFYDAALGAVGLRPNYGQHYYAAFVIDPDGHHVEAVA